MALLQISEPGMSPDPHQRRVAVGIDLGTTNSLVAAVRSGSAEVIRDDAGRALLPSVVRYGPQGVVAVGDEAKAAVSKDPRNTIVSVKRFMGRGVRDIAHVEELPYDFVDAPGMVRLKTAAGERSPVQVSADILSTLRRRAEQALLNAADAELYGAVITVPAYFDDAQRQATKDAAELAGIKVLRLINEPTAAALAYGLDNAAEGVYAVYDLGGGTFDISILRLTRGVFEVLSTGGDTALGGDDFDRRLFCWVVEEAKLPPLSDADAQTLLTASRQAKERLSSAESTDLRVTLADGTEVSRTITREQFVSLTQPLVAKTLTAAKRALRDAKLTPDQIKGVVMVGGSTRMPQVRDAVGQMFGSEPLVNLDPDQVVALGAAIQANALAGNKAGDDDWLLLDVIPLSLGLEMMGGLVERIIPRNSTIPVARAQDFTTYKDGQTALAVHVVQGERDLVADCRSLARFDLRGIPPMAAGAARIRVTFQVDADGLLSVTARELQSGVEAAIDVKPAYGLGDDDIARMLQESFKEAEADMKRRALREIQVDGERLIEATESALLADSDLLSADQLAEIRGLIARLRQATQGDDGAAIRVAIDALSHGTEAFAAQRMDRSIRQALAGQRIDAL